MTMLPEQSGDLFRQLPAFLPALVPRETLYSWSARYHRLSGNVQAIQSSLQLFGDIRSGLRHDFPSQFERFVQITHGLLGDPESIANERTLLGFFVPFLDEARYTDVLGQMMGWSVFRIKSTLGLMPSRVGAAHPLKACDACIAEDRRKLGFSIWNVEHQWPSVWICRRHNRPLQVLRNSRELKSLRRYILPEDLHSEEWTFHQLTKGVKSRLLELATFSSDLIATRQSGLSSAIVRYACLIAAEQRRWVASDGSTRFDQVKNAFAAHYSGLEQLPGFGILDSINRRHGGFLAMMLRSYEGVRHPVKQVLLANFLFGSASIFLEAYEQAKAEVESGNVSKFGSPPHLDWRAELRRLIEVDHQSMNQAANSLGISVPQAIHWANKDGIGYSKRPRVLTVELEEELRSLALQGLTLEAIAKTAGVKKGFVRAHLANDPPLRDLWRASWFANERQRRRSDFLLLLNANRGVPLKHIRRIPGNHYSWLHRNDGDWLASNLPTLG